MPFYPVEKKINKWPDSLVTIKSVNSFFKIRFMPAAGHKVIDYQSYRFSLHDYAIFIFFVLHLYFFRWKPEKLKKKKKFLILKQTVVIIG